MHTGLYNRNRKARNTSVVDFGAMLDDGLTELGLEQRLGDDQMLMAYVT
jgi:hypothetical protein